MKYFLFSLFCYFSFISVSAAQETPVSMPADKANSVSDSSAQQSAAGSDAAKSVSAEAAVASSTQAVQPNSVETSSASVQAAAADGQSSEPAAEIQQPERPKNKSYFAPVRNHNPMMSPRDYDKIRREEQAKLDAEKEARLAAERAAQAQQSGYEYNPETNVVRKKTNPLAILEKRLRLQGIMGNMVIINGETYSKGEVISRTGGAKVKNIGGNYIIVEYKGKTFKKVMKN